MVRLLSSIGGVFAVIAGLLLFGGFRMETTVQGPDTPAGFQGVANLQLMHIQSVNFQIAIGSAIIAALFFCAAAITSRLPPPPHE